MNLATNEGHTKASSLPPSLNSSDTSLAGIAEREYTSQQYDGILLSFSNTFLPQSAHFESRYIYNIML